jgi:hypothetical protein
VLDSAESVFIADLTAPLSERAVMNFYDRAAVTADQVVMVTVGARAVGRFAVRAADRIDLAVLFEATEVAVNGGKPDLVESLVQLLRGQRTLALLQRFDD